jgi:hypothetical protein
MLSFQFCGFYYKHIAFINDVSRVIGEWRHNLERHTSVVNYATRGVIAPIYNVYSTDVTYDDHQDDVECL